jgi:hypothetical protein
MPDYSNVGQYGGIDESLYLKKMETTCNFEDPEMLYNYNRANLKDIRPDAPILESDQPRYNNYSADRLNLRHVGRRTEAEPWLPDGTFLDFDFLNKDPRGHALEPDMREHVKQQQARTKFIKHGIDVDHSVPSGGGINPTRMVMNMKATLPCVKQRLKIFDDSLSQYNRGGMSHTMMTDAEECVQKTDDKSPDMRDEICDTRMNKQNDLSNDTQIGWRTTTDNTFKVAKYGQIRRGPSCTTQDAYKNRGNVYTTHDTVSSYFNQNTAAKTAAKMIDIIKKREMAMENGKDMEFDESGNNQAGRKQKITPSDLKPTQIESFTSQPVTAHTELNPTGTTSHFKGNMLKPKLDSNKMKKSIVDPLIVDIMVGINRKMTPREIKDLREAIQQSAEEATMLIQQANTKQTNKEITNKLLWDSQANHEKGKSYKIANYSKLGSNICINKPKNHRAYDFEPYKLQQKIYGQRRGNIQNPSLYNMDVIEYDQNAPLDVVGTKLIGGFGSKYTQPYIDKGDMSRNEEITARN